MKNIKYIKSAVSLDDLPKDNLKEIVLCGRSNVGKSTFINNLFSKKGLAKTSSSPGKTRTLNYYLVEEKFYLVDLPGFGYAKVPENEKLKWQKMVNDFLVNSKNIAAAFHFIDSRHKPTALDKLLQNYISNLEIDYYIILNKIDKLNQSQLSKAIKTIKSDFPLLDFQNNLLQHSSLKKIDNKKYFNLFNKYIS